MLFCYLRNSETGQFREQKLLINLERTKKQQIFPKFAFTQDRLEFLYPKHSSYMQLTLHYDTRKVNNSLYPRPCLSGRYMCVAYSLLQMNPLFYCSRFWPLLHVITLVRTAIFVFSLCVRITRFYGHFSGHRPHPHPTFFVFEN